VLKLLSEWASVHLACLSDEPVSSEVTTTLSRYCQRLAIVQAGGIGRWTRAIFSLVRGGSVTEGAFNFPELHRVLREWTAEIDFDAALASASSMIPYFYRLDMRGRPVVIDLMDVDSQKWLDYAAGALGPRAWLYRLESKRLRRLERGAAAWAHALTLSTDAEADLYRRVCTSGPVHAVTNGVDLDAFQPRTEEEQRDTCVFVGALDYRPNVDGAVWFCREAWPEILHRRPRARVQLVGRRPVREVRRLAALPGIDVVGQVPDVRPYLARASVAIVPLRIARGVQNKVLEALAMSKATIASPGALEGLDPSVHEAALSASSAAEWVDTVLRLFDDDALRRRLAAAGRRFVEQHHCWERCLEPFLWLLNLVPQATKERSCSLQVL
jgi:sugar transferase (PEP-CTERM/EpsH1 system associated)